MKILRKIQTKLEILHKEVERRASGPLRKEDYTVKGTLKVLFYGGSWYLLWIPILFLSVINGEEEENRRF